MDDWVEIVAYVFLLVAIVAIAYFAGRLRERTKWEEES